MKEWEHHVAHTHEELKGKSWCGADIRYEWHFVDIDHATYSAPKCYVQPCKKCIKVIIRDLKGKH